MADKKNVFISHVHDDDKLLPKLKDLISKAGMEVSDGSINSEKPNMAKSEDYIKQKILAPRIQWASTLVVLITRDTADSWWVNWEIDQAVAQGKNVVGVFAQGATTADIPEALGKCGDAVIVGWHGERIVAAIKGEIQEWDDPETGEPRNREWIVKRITCR
ncbi:MAG: TIR domain-containing protein [Nitrospirales bacterium]|nr:TIR domain-containing protein [Nitrospirales bacterium]